MLESNFNSKGQYDIPECYVEKEMSEEEKNKIKEEWCREVSFEEIVEKYSCAF